MHSKSCNERVEPVQVFGWKEEIVARLWGEGEIRARAKR
jgi:hypothetical protein